MTTTQTAIAPSTETGKIGIMHLKRFWSRTIAKRNGAVLGENKEWNLDVAVMSVLEIGIEPTLKFLFAEAPSFDEFENWILGLNNGELPLEKINSFNASISQTKPAIKQEIEPVLTPQEMQFWEENGYIIVRNAVPETDCQNAVKTICEFIEADLEKPQTWYHHHQAKQGIMVQMFQHPVLEKNRQAPKIRKAFEQLWGRTDILQNTDRVSFNPPQTERHPFQGPDLHWDVSINPPIPFGLQGLLYLTDTAENQGAFTLVPGFHHKIENWINNLPPNTNPRTQNLHALGSKPIAANAGDFIIWHQALPHGSSSNTSQRPRIVQYINYQPVNAEYTTDWK